MTAKEQLIKIKEFFADLATPAAPAAMEAPVAPAAPIEAMTADGKKVTISALEAGGTVTITDETGAAAPAPAGELALEDGTIIVVAEGGVIGEVRTAAPAMPAPFDAQAKFTEFETTTTQKFSEYEQKFSSYEQKFSDYEVKLAKAEKVIGGLLDLTSLLAEEPSAPADPGASTAQILSKEEARKEKFNTISNSLFSKKVKTA
jgi:hypothetical protein